MNVNTSSIDDELKAAQIENIRRDSEAKSLDIQSRKFDFENRPGFWKAVLASPAFLAALIAVLATLGSASVTWIIAGQQQESDRKRVELQISAEKQKNIDNINLERTKYQISLLSGMLLAAKPGESCPIANQLTVYRGAQIFTDVGLREEAQRMHSFYSDQCRTSGR